MASQPGERQRESRPPRGPGLPPAPKDVYLAAPMRRRCDLRRFAVIALGLIVFAAIDLVPRPGPAIDLHGRIFALSREGQDALAIFVLAVLWWGFEVVPIGVTGLAVGVLQSVFHVRPAREALGDLLDPAVCFVLGSFVVGMAFARTGLTQRLAYSVLAAFGERTPFIYLGAFATTFLLALFMAHTAAAAAVFPLLMALYPLYDEGRRPTRFGKGLFIGVAMTAGAGSIVTMLGSGRAAVAAGFFGRMGPRDVPFLELTRYLLPLGLVLLFTLWLLMLMVFRPEKPSIAGLRERLLWIRRKQGRISARELTTLAVAGAMLLALGVESFAPGLAPHKAAVVLGAGVALYLTRVLAIEDLEAMPWNIVLLFGGATSLGLCLWQTGATRWLAVKGLALWGHAHWLAFVLAAALAVLLLTNVVMNVALIAVALPVGLVTAPYLGVAPELVFYAVLAAAGLPLLLVAGGAPNAMAYESRQFTAGEFIRAGVPATAAVMAVLALFVLAVWPLLGMPIHL